MRGLPRERGIVVESVSMKGLILSLMLAAPVPALGGAAGDLGAEMSGEEIIGGMPLTDLLGERYKAALPVQLGKARFLATVMFDSGWEEWFALKPEGCGTAGAWNREMLEAGVDWESGGLKLRLKRDGDRVLIESAAGTAEVPQGALFDLLYEKSPKVTFGGMVSYAVVRNLEPLSEREGTVTLRIGSDGLYYYSLTPDADIAGGARWLLAVNGVLYGLRIDSGSLLFVSKVIEMGAAPAHRRERPRGR